MWTSWASTPRGASSPEVPLSAWRVWRSAEPWMRMQVRKVFRTAAGYSVLVARGIFSNFLDTEK